jgi:ribosomal protein L29
MKMTEIKNKWKSLDAQQLQQELVNTRRALFSLRLNSVTGHVKDHSQFKKLRRQIACISTFITQRVG